MTYTIAPPAPFEKATLTCPSGSILNVLEATAGAEALGLIHINHGAAEHAARYAELAGQLTAAGFHVIAHDHRGHGETDVPGLPQHMFGGDQGWDYLIEDIAFLNDHLKERFPTLPMLIIGHSMGAVATFEFALRYPERPTGIVLLGPPMAKFPVDPAIWLLKAERLFKQPKDVSGLFKKLAWDGLNKPFEPGRTGLDWLSTDTSTVDTYIADPQCGWEPTSDFALGMLRGIKATFDDDRLKSLPSDLPFLIMSGAEDPATNRAKSVTELEARLKAASLIDIETRIFDGMRHEMHNEVGREQLFEALVSWCTRVATEVRV